jgi:hypothetical protein
MEPHLEIWFNLPIHEWDYKLNYWFQNLHTQKKLIYISTKIKQGDIDTTKLDEVHIVKGVAQS